MYSSVLDDIDKYASKTSVYLQLEKVAIVNALQPVTSSWAIAERPRYSGSVLAKSGRRYSADNIGLSYDVIS